MSCIGGVLFFRESRPDSVAATVDRLAAGLDHLGPDGVATHRSERLGMVHRPFHITPESRRERQPVVAGDGRALTWDGRLDNRDELGRALRLDPAATDPEIVLAALERWGPDAVERLIGDFALALYEPAVDRVILARDPFGVRPLFYHCGAEALTWASSLEALIAAAGLDRSLDEEWIAGYLVHAAPGDRTPYRSLRAVAPGELVVSRAGRCRRSAHWRPEDAPAVEPASDRELEERFANLLRADGPVGAELSGGVDSSSNVCLAHELITTGEVPATDILPVSDVFDAADSSDERRWIREVEGFTGRTSCPVAQDDFPLFAELGHFETEAPSTFHCYQAREREVRRHLRARGARVLLSGYAGDSIVWSEVDRPYLAADCLRRGALRSAIHELGSWHRQSRSPHIVNLWDVALLLAPPHVRRLASARRGPLPAWIDPRFARLMNLGRRWAGAEATSRTALPSRRVRESELRHNAQVAAWKWDQPGERTELTFPFLHRPLVELCLGLPPDQLIRGEETRSIHRRALRGRLPETVRQRPCKRGPSEANLRDFARQWHKLAPLLQAPRAAELGFLDAKAFEEAVTRSRFGVQSGGVLLLNAIALEAWLRSLDARPG